MDDLTFLELELILNDKIKTLRELEAKIENMYEIGAYDNAEIEDIIKIEDIIEKKGGKIKMDKQELYEILETMTEQLGTDVLLENMAIAMSSKELQENLEFIDRMHDLDNF